MGGVTITLGACMVGAGTGSVSGTLALARCGIDTPTDWNMGASYFAGQVFMSSLEIRLQQGGDIIEFSDGLIIRLRDYASVPIGVPMPVGPGTPIEASLYLNRTCALAEFLTGVSGTVTFSSLYSGAGTRIAGTFTLHFEDLVYPGNSADLTGDFDFLYRRGQPAQPFS